MTPRTIKARTTKIEGKGRGLLAGAPIEADEIIDVASTIVLSATDCDLLEQTAVGDYYFAHPSDPELGLVVLGLPSLSNHAESPNSDIRWHCDEGVGWVAELYALRPIAAGEEITRRYRCAPWFKIAS